MASIKGFIFYISDKFLAVVSAVAIGEDEKTTAGVGARTILALNLTSDSII